MCCHSGFSIHHGKMGWIEEASLLALAVPASNFPAELEVLARLHFAFTAVVVVRESVLKSRDWVLSYYCTLAVPMCVAKC